MLELKGISKYYNVGSVNEMCLFQDFNLNIEKGEFLSVVGSNGSAKTSMLNIICGSIPVESGQILTGDTDITKEKEKNRPCLSEPVHGHVSKYDNSGKYGTGRQ